MILVTLIEKEKLMCLSDRRAKKIPTPAEKQVLQKAGLGLKRIKFIVEDDEVAVYNQLTGRVESDETAGYPQLTNCGGFELLRCIPNCKVLEPINVVIPAKNLKAAAEHPSNTKIPVIPLKSETSFFSSSVLKEKCVLSFHIEFPLNSLRAHV